MCLLLLSPSPHVTEFVQFQVHISLSECINVSRSEVCFCVCFCIPALEMCSHVVAVRVCLCVCVCIYLTALIAPTGAMQRPLAVVRCPLYPPPALSSSASVNLQTTRQQMPYKPYSSLPPSFPPPPLASFDRESLSRTSLASDVFTTCLATSCLPPRLFLISVRP